MNKHNIYHVITIFIVAFLSVFAGCENKDEINGAMKQAATLDIKEKLVRLVGDSTDIAAMVKVNSNLSEIKLKWNVPAECNIDTSVISLPVHNGNCLIPIRWKELTDSINYAPRSKAFNVGVLVSAGDLSKYIHLIWADEVDSLKLDKEYSALTRADEVMPITEVLDITPSEVLNMDKVVGGAMYVNFSGVAAVIVDPSNISESTNIAKGEIPPLLRTPDAISFKWEPEAPTTSFSTRISFSGGSITKTVNINYTVPYEEPLVWEFISASIGDGNDIPSTNASVLVQAKTNKPWSIESPEGLISPVPDFTTGIGIKTLTMNYTNNPSTNKRSVSLVVKSQGVIKETLTFMQMGIGDVSTGTVFEFISADPVHNTTISSVGQPATFKVKTDYAWWIEVEGVKTSYPAGELGEKTGVIALPANPTTDYRIVTCIIGYDNMTAKTISYIQPGEGSDAGLTYVSSNLPTGNIPQTGGSYQFTFTGSYTGGVQLRALFDGVAQAAGTVVTNKKPEITVAPNNGAARNVTFEYKLEIGDWMALPTSTNRVQDAGDGGGGDAQTLTYVSSTLPTGNIPASATMYTFNFEGGYTGQLRVRSVNADTGSVLFNGPIGTTHSPKVTVPANTATDTRNIKFQYRLIDIAGALWIDLPASTDRVQDADNGGGGGETPGENITPGKILPPGDVPEEGRSYYCLFKGTGSVIFRALRNGTEVARSEQGTATATGINLGVVIPRLESFNSTISFEYSTDGGNTWINMNDNRLQKNDYIVVTPADVVRTLPAKNASRGFKVRGTIKTPIEIFAVCDGVKIGRASIYPQVEEVILNVPVENNPGPSVRYVSFSWSFDGEHWTSTPPAKQFAP